MFGTSGAFALLAVMVWAALREVQLLLTQPLPQSQSARSCCRSKTRSTLLLLIIVPSLRFQQGPGDHQQQTSSGVRQGVGGVAYGGYARKVVGRALDRLPGGGANERVETHPGILSEALEEAFLLVGGLKRP